MLADVTPSRPAGDPPETRRLGFVQRLTAAGAVPLQIALLAVVLTAIGARIVEVPHYLADSGDEWGNAIAPLRVLYERGNPGTFIHPALYYEVTAVVDVLLFGALALGGAIAPGSSMTDLLVRDQSWFVFAARAVSVGSSVLAMAALYVLGRRLWNRTAGLLAAALLAVLPLHAVYSEAARVDSLFLAILLWGVVAILRLLEDRRLASYRRAGIWVGLATAANYNGAILLPWLVAAHCLPDPAARTEPRAGLRRLATALGWTGAVFLATNPFALLGGTDFFRDVVMQMELSWLVHPGAEARDLFFYARDFWATSPLLAGVVAGSWMAVTLGGARAHRFVSSLAGAYFVLFSAVATRYDRFMLPALALGMLLAGGLPFVLGRRLARWPLAAGLSSAMLLPLPLACIAELAPQAIPVPRHTMLPRFDDRVLAWLAAHAPPGSTVMTESGVLPLLDLVEEPGALGTAVRASLVRLRPGIDLRFVGAVYLGGRSNYHGDLLTAERVDFAVISIRNVEYAQAHCDALPDVCAFYRDLRARGRIVFESPEGVESAIVYAVKPS